MLVDKSADKDSVDETGEDVVFTFTVTNESAESVEITSLEDSVYGTLTGDVDCKVGTVLPVGTQVTVTRIDVLGIGSLEPEEIIIASGVEDGEAVCPEARRHEVDVDAPGLAAEDLELTGHRHYMVSPYSFRSSISSSCSALTACVPAPPHDPAERSAGVSPGNARPRLGRSIVAAEVLVI